MKIYKHRLLRPHSQRNMYREMKEEITCIKTKQKNYSKLKRNKVTTKDKIPFLKNFTDFEQAFAD